MRYIIEIPQNQSDQIKKLVMKGQYGNVNQFVCTAIDNQLHIEGSEIGFQEAIGVNGGEVISSPERVRDINKGINMEQVDVSIETAPMPAFKDLSSSKQDIPEESVWLWGQVNKILPIKIGLRVLLSMQSLEKNIILEEFSERATEVAASYGTDIRFYEDRKKKTRDTRISAGLPSEDEFKSKLRYKGQFLAYIRKDELMEGAMSFLRFVNIRHQESNGPACIYLTEAGAKFAQLSNPVPVFIFFIQTELVHPCH